MPRSYPPEFCHKVLDLLKAGRKVADLVRDLQISDQTIYTWRRQELIDNWAVARDHLARGRRAGRRPQAHRRVGDRAGRPPPRGRTAGNLSRRPCRGGGVAQR